MPNQPLPEEVQKQEKRSLSVTRPTSVTRSSHVLRDKNPERKVWGGLNQSEG